MDHLIRRGIALAALLLLGAAPEDPVCTTLDSCIAVLRAPLHDDQRYNADRAAQAEASARIIAQGDAGFTALLPLLADRDREIRSTAAYALGRFPAIDPRHVPALIAAFPANHALAAALAVAGTDEAMAALQQALLREPIGNISQEITAALTRFGERNFPFLRTKLATCRARSAGCYQALWLLETYKPYPDWAVPMVFDIGQRGRGYYLRLQAETMLERRHLVEAVPLLLDRLRERALGSRKWDQADSGILSLATYGADAIAAGPIIALYLSRANEPDSRAAAAYAVGAIGYRAAIPQLLAFTAREYDDDWRLAYNASESLARLGAAEARPMLQRLAAEHWHAPVRNNAARALAMLNGGAFARPGIAGDGDPYPANTRRDNNPNPDKLRYAGDASGSVWVSNARTEDALRLAQAPPGEVVMPASGSRYYDETRLPREESDRVKRLVPDWENQPGTVTAWMPFRHGRIIGLDGGEWWGGMAYYGYGRPVWLEGGNIGSAFWWGGRFYVLTNMYHMDAGPGYLVEIDLQRLKRVRRIRLPHNPGWIAATASGALIVRTKYGDIAIRRDGTPANPALFSD